MLLVGMHLFCFYFFSGNSFSPPIMLNILPLVSTVIINKIIFCQIFLILIHPFVYVKILLYTPPTLHAMYVVLVQNIYWSEMSCQIIRSTQFVTAGFEQTVNQVKKFHAALWWY